jgi:signal peptidase I
MRSGRRAVLAVAGLCLVLVGVGALSGRTGGPITWVVTAGTSMQPEIDPGTLVVVQRRVSYEVGDVVAYRSAQLGQTVLHRIIGVEGDRLVLRGDANDWVDPETPTPDDVLGERALQLPGAGRVLGLLKSPLVLGIAVGLIALPFLGGSSGRSGVVPRRRRSSSPPTPGAPAPTAAGKAFALPSSGPTWTPDPDPEPEAVAELTPAGSAGTVQNDAGFLTVPEPLRVSPAVEAAIAVAAGSALLLGALATVGPFVERPSAQRQAEHVVTWSYDARVTPGLSYPDGVVRTGDPLYHRLVSAAEVSAELQVAVPPGVEVAGSWRLAVTIADDSGWRRPTYLGTPRPLASGTQSLAVRVPTVDLLDLAKRAALEAGAEPGSRRITVQAQITVTGVDGQQQPLFSSPAIDFTLDDRQARLVDAAQLEQREQIPLPASARPSEFAALGLRAPASQVRLGALAMGVLSLLVLGLLRAARRNDDEDVRIARAAGHLLVPMTDLEEPDRTVDVTDFASLAAIAARYQRMVLYGDSHGLRVYLVLDDGVAYRYYSAAAAAAIDASSQREADEHPHGASWTLPEPRSPEREPARR